MGNLAMLPTIPNLTPTSMKEIFSDRMYKGPNIRSQTDFEVPRVNSVKGQETLSFLEPKIWDIIPGNIKKASSFTIFKNKVGSRKVVHANCKYYVQGLGYVSIT